MPFWEAQGRLPEGKSDIGHAASCVHQVKKPAPAFSLTLIASFLWCSSCHTVHFLVQPISSWGTFPSRTTEASTLCMPSVMITKTASWSPCNITQVLVLWLELAPCVNENSKKNWWEIARQRKRFIEVWRHSTIRQTQHLLQILVLFKQLA